MYFSAILCVQCLTLAEVDVMRENCKNDNLHGNVNQDASFKWKNRSRVKNKKIKDELALYHTSFAVFQESSNSSKICFGMTTGSP